jgi:hypothetical protein
MLNAVRRGVARAAVPAAAEETRGNRIFVEDPGEVLALARYSGFDYVKRVTPFAGKWMRFSGRLEGIAESLGRDFIHLTLLLNDGQRVNVQFAADTKQHLDGLKTGRRVTVIGQVPVSGSILMPENCELAGTT